MTEKSKPTVRVSCWVEADICTELHIEAYKAGLPIRKFVARAIVAYLKWIRLADLKICLETEREERSADLEKILELQKALIKKIHRKPTKKKNSRYPGMYTKSWQTRIAKRQEGIARSQKINNEAESGGQP